MSPPPQDGTGSGASREAGWGGSPGSGSRVPGMSPWQSVSRGWGWGHAEHGEVCGELTQEVVDAEIAECLGHVADGEAQVPHGQRLPRRLAGARQLTLVLHAVQ